MPDEVSDNRAAIDISTGDRACAIRMIVHERGQLESGLSARRRRKAARAFHGVPAVVHAFRGRRDYVDFLEPVLPDVRDIEQTAEFVECKSPRIPQSIRPDFPARIWLTDKWIVRWNR